MIIQEIDEKAIQRRVGEMVRVLRGEADPPPGAKKRRESATAAAAAKLNGPVELPAPVPPIVEAVDEELRRALAASQLTFAEEECRRGRRLKPQRGEGSSRGAVIPPEEEAHGLGEITGEVVLASRGEEDSSRPAVGVIPEEACVSGEDDVTTMQEEEAPAGLAASSLVFAF